MHRQSLGSPSSKLHANGPSAAALQKEDSHIIASAVETQKILYKAEDNVDEDDHKSQKMKSQKTSAKKLAVHLIPLLVFLCILVLYLFSHDPPLKGLVEFDAIEGLPATMDLKHVGQIPRLMKTGEGGVLGIQSMRNLQEDKKVNLKYRLNRKMGDV